MSEPEIRRAAEDDAATLARFAERCFRAAFGAENRAEDMDRHCAANFGEARQRAEIADPAVETLVVEAGGSLAAYVQLGWDPAPASVGGSRPAQIRRFYVDAPWHGRGLAQRLMTRAVELAAEGGADRVWLGVWERNPRGIAFYRKVGFVACGEQTFVLGTDPQRDLVLVRELDARAG